MMKQWGRVTDREISDFFMRICISGEPFGALTRQTGGAVRESADG